MTPSDQLRTRQFNVRLTDEEAAMLQRLAMQNGVSPSEYLRHLLRQSDEVVGGTPRRLSTFHVAVLLAMADEPGRAWTAIDLISPMASKGHDDPWLGNRIARALLELEQLGSVE